jgi:hypothetical protein
MSKLQKHIPCPQGSVSLSRLPTGYPLPAGDIKTVYARIKRRWVRVGWLCLDCHRFQPDPTHYRSKLDKELQK